MTTWRKLHSGLPDWLLIASTVIVAVMCIGAIACAGVSIAYRGRILPNVSVAGSYVGGMPAEDAKSVIAHKISFLEKGVPVRFKDDEYLASALVSSDDPDLSQPLVIFDEEATLSRAVALGHSGNLVQNIIEQFQTIVSGRQLPLAVSVDKQRLVADLRQAFSKHEQPPRDARLVIDSRERVSIEPEQDGSTFDYDSAADQIGQHLAEGSLQPVQLSLRDAAPSIQDSEIGDVSVAVKNLLETPPLTLKYEKQSWVIDRRIIRSLIGIEKKDGRVIVTLTSEAIKAYLAKNVAPKIDSEPEEARLAIENGRVSVFQPGKDGVSVDMEATAAAIAAWPENQASELEVVVVKKENTVTTSQSAEELGLKEIIGTGTSQFSGSPANRRHNIKTGAMALNGLLIKPGEEFSLLKALGEIDGAHGYLPELVIKGNKTTPEYGGGLCQIGTTVFRATFNSGLPVTQRRNHSYRVSYYEPAGTDATIYDPAPDYRFVNDTGHYILIQARLNGNELAFDFWGTKDGRVVETSKPVIYNIVPPKPTRIVETTELPEGKKKCTESAHAGADAYFDTKVTYASGEVREKRFSSHYVPWQAVCLVGVKKLETTPEALAPGTPTTTVTPAVAPSIQ